MKTKKQFEAVMFKDLLFELAKFDPSATASIIASTDMDSPEDGHNFVDGAGVKGAFVKDGVLFVVCGDSGRMTWRQLRDGIEGGVTLKMAEEKAVVKIGYGRGPRSSELYDFDDEFCAARTVEDCKVLGDDTIWNVALGPEA